MSRYLITDMSHFLDKNGTIPESLPNKARTLSQRIGAIVLAVTEDPQTSQNTVVPCWNTINRKKCTGLIDAGRRCCTNKNLVDTGSNWLVLRHFH